MIAALSTSEYEWATAAVDKLVAEIERGRVQWPNAASIRLWVGELFADSERAGFIAEQVIGNVNLLLGFKS